MIQLGSRIKKFTYTGSTQYFTVPDNVTTIYVSGCGGGGGGAVLYLSNSYYGSSGGATSMGVFPSILFTLGGGGGAYGSPVNPAANPNVGQSGGFGAESGIGTEGGSNIFSCRNAIGYGAGGSGSSKGGGAGGCYLKEAVTVVPGTTYSITIGNGGAGGTYLSLTAQSGTDGFVLIEW